MLFTKDIKLRSWGGKGYVYIYILSPKREPLSVSVTGAVILYNYIEKNIT